MKSLAFILPLMLFATPMMAQKDSKNPTTSEEDFVTPKRDQKGMKAEPDKIDPSLPNVLILGDSISIAYTIPLRAELDGKANVFRPKDNCGDTDSGLRNLTKWLGSNKWDVIHFNWGLHDLCYRNPEVKTQGHRDKVNGKQSVPPADYDKNLEELVTRLKATGASLVWASTTIVPENEIGRFVGDDVKYNAIAAKIMERHGIPTNDLYTLSKSLSEKRGSSRGDVHFNQEDSILLAKQAAASIELVLGKRAATIPPK